MLKTETRNEKTMHIDKMSNIEMLTTHSSQLTAT